MNKYQSLQKIFPILIVLILLMNQFRHLQQQNTKQFFHLWSKTLIPMKTSINQNKNLIKIIPYEKVLNLVMKLDIVPEVH
ncbi:unnamed protein product [Paramecium octaurelia]|uniref:Uncharacterized protein n=1 Tax=Paramecium octaurelia TaxID=43137 RepID=A0A8S1V6N5_PAROT|nr:unnamed protein product [Paramecium octaurelia]